MTEEMKVNDATRYIVVCLHDDEKVLAVFDNEGDATVAAKEQALHDEQDRCYAVYQKLGSAQAVRKADWKGASR